MKTFLPSLMTTSITTIPMVTVATQTDGCVEMAYQELCGSLSMATAIDIYDWDEEEEYKVDDFTGNLQRVMSSQTDLALSDFDLSRCLQLEDDDEEEEDEEEDEDMILHGQDDCDDDTYNDSHATMTEEPASQPELQSNSTGRSKGSLTCETISSKLPKNRQAMNDSTPPSKQHLKCHESSEKRFLRELEKRSSRPANGYSGAEYLAERMGQIKLSDSHALASSAQEAMKQRRYCFRDRMVPRMGTKIEFLKTLPNRQVFHGPGSCPQPAMLPKVGLGTGVKVDDRNAIDFLYANLDENFMVNTYHSDSEKSYASICGGGHHKDWSSDGDADCIVQSIDGGIGQSLHIINDKLSPESRCKVESLRNTYEQFADIMYTNEANLQHTIMLQQRLFKQQLATRNLQDVSNCKKVTNLPDIAIVAKQFAQTASDTCQVQAEIHPAPADRCSSEKKSPLEWIVKRRPDGSRYVTRRPVRSKLLKERAKQLAAQRDNILTTDDETASEVKIGRYWSKEERKRQLEKARNQKRHRENIMRTRAVKEELPKHDGFSATQQHKLTKQQSRRIVENFTTLKELMLQRGVDSKGKSFSPLLSVTTI